MSAPKYYEGERVVVVPEPGNSNVRPGMYTIIRVMPASPEGIQYRAKNDMDTHERVLHEAQLRPVAPLMTENGLRETPRSTSSGGEPAYRKRPQSRRDHTVQTHAGPEQGSGNGLALETPDRHLAPPSP